MRRFFGDTFFFFFFSVVTAWFCILLCIMCAGSDRDFMKRNNQREERLMFGRGDAAVAAVALYMC